MYDFVFLVYLGVRMVIKLFKYLNIFPYKTYHKITTCDDNLIV